MNISEVQEVPVCTRCNSRPRYVEPGTGKISWLCGPCKSAYQKERAEKKRQEELAEAKAQGLVIAREQAVREVQDDAHLAVVGLVTDMTLLLEHAREVSQTQAIALEMRLVAEGSIVRMGVEKGRGESDGTA